MSTAIIRAQAAFMIHFLDQRLHAGLLSAEEHLVAIGEIERWAERTIAKIIGTRT